LNGDFQQTYQAAERAYGGGDYETAHHLASDLLQQLEVEVKADDELVRNAVLGWQALCNPFARPHRTAWPTTT
jgi:hypothetical protein